MSRQQQLYATGADGRGDIARSRRRARRMTDIETRLAENTQPIEVWLSQTNMQITCRIVYEDETTAETGADSLSMRGAQREITSWLIERGYEPAGRWATEHEGNGGGAR
jgi:hypothetical protein